MKLAIIAVLLSAALSLHAETPGALEASGIAALKLSQTNPDAVISAAIHFGNAAVAYEKAGDEAKATEMNSFLYWCKKKMTLQQMETFLKGGAGAGEAAARMNALDKAVAKADDATLYFSRAEAYARAHPDEHLLIAIRYFEVAERFKGNDLSLQAQDRSLKEMQIALQAAASAAAPAHWTPLFNGKDLTGWEGDSSVWRVANGAIVGRAAHVDQNTFLIYKTPQSNFVLRAEWKMTKAGSFPNSGIQFRSKLADPKKFTVSGYQMDIGDGHFGDLHEELGRSLIMAPAPEAVSSIRENDWNRYEITANGPRIQMSINGIAAVDWEERDPKRFVRRGLIALQYHHPGENFEIQFRAIELNALPSPAEPDMTTFPAGSKPVNLLPLINSAQGTISGKWAMKNGALSGEGSNDGILEIPYAPPAEYDYRIEFTRTDGKEAVLQLFPHGGKSLGWAVGAYGNAGCTFLPAQNGVFVKPLDKGKWLFANRRHVSLVQVRDDKVRGYLDGNLIMESGYDGLGDGKWHTRNAANLGVAFVGNVTFHAIELLPVKR